MPSELEIKEALVFKARASTLGQSYEMAFKLIQEEYDGSQLPEEVGAKFQKLHDVFFDILWKQQIKVIEEGQKVALAVAGGDKAKTWTA